MKTILRQHPHSHLSILHYSRLLVQPSDRTFTSKRTNMKRSVRLVVVLSRCGKISYCSLRGSILIKSDSLDYYIQNMISWSKINSYTGPNRYAHLLKCARAAREVVSLLNTNPLFVISSFLYRNSKECVIYRL